MDYQQFRREALILKSIRHPGIPIVYDLEETATHFYLIEECLEGENLSQLISDMGHLSPAMTVSCGIQICHLVNILHSAKPNPILYLDLQPKNLIICHDTVKLIDFDHAIRLNEAGGLTKRYGTVGFAAPEQYTNENLDERTDIYAIGAVLYYMLTGRFPENRSMVWAWQVGLRLSRVIEKCLKKEPGQRYGSVAELCEGLEKVQKYQKGFSGGELSSLTVAVAGTAPGAGVTHIAMGLAVHLKRGGQTALYKENNSSGAVLQYADCAKAAMDPCGIFQIRGLHMLPDYGAAVRLETPAYRIVIKDCGKAGDGFFQEPADAYLLVCGAKPWEWKRTEDALKKAGDLPGLAVVYNHYCRPMKNRPPAPPKGTPFFLMPEFSDPWSADKNVEIAYDRLWAAWTGDKRKGFWKRWLGRGKEHVSG